MIKLLKNILINLSQKFYDLIIQKIKSSVDHVKSVAGYKKKIEVCDNQPIN